MRHILANDGISNQAVVLLEQAGFSVKQVRVAQEQLVNYINENDIEILLVRSATKVNAALLANCPGLKIIGRGGVGLDNIDLDAAKSYNIKVINTPKASSFAVAELVIAHLFSGARFLYDANRNMPLEGDTKFKQLKKSYAKGTELRGKTLGIIGFGSIGQAVASLAIGLGMRVVAADPFLDKATIGVHIFSGDSLEVEIKTIAIEQVYTQADFISIHVPAQEKPLISALEFNSMKDGVFLINASRGGVVEENALLDAIENKKVAFAGLDVFENEPVPSIKTLMNPNISLTPHIGAATIEAQDRIGISLAEQIISISKEEKIILSR